MRNTPRLLRNAVRHKLRLAAREPRNYQAANHNSPPSLRLRESPFPETWCDERMPQRYGREPCRRKPASPDRGKREMGTYRRQNRRDRPGPRRARRQIRGRGRPGRAPGPGRARPAHRLGTPRPHAAPGSSVSEKPPPCQRSASRCQIRDGYRARCRSWLRSGRRPMTNQPATDADKDAGRASEETRPVQPIGPGDRPRLSKTPVISRPLTC